MVWFDLISLAPLDVDIVQTVQIIATIHYVKTLLQRGQMFQLPFTYHCYLNNCVQSNDC